MTWTPEDEWVANADLKISELTKRVAGLEAAAAKQRAANAALLDRLDQALGTMHERRGDIGLIIALREALK